MALYVEFICHHNETGSHRFQGFPFGWEEKKGYNPPQKMIDL